jgi:hypothetical protein
VALALGIWLLLRPKETKPVPRVVEARRELQALAGQPEDGTVLSRTSQVLRSYVSSSFGLASGQLTTREVCDAVSMNHDVGPELANDIAEFLRSCDRQKFSPTPPLPQPRFGAVSKALAIIDKTENRLTTIRQDSVACPADTGSSARAAGRGMGSRPT